jgi:hypothetical protein
MLGLSSPHGTKQGAIALLLESLNSLLRQGNAVLLELIETSVQVDKGEVQTKALGQSLEDLPSSRDNLTANAVAGEQT